MPVPEMNTSLGKRKADQIGEEPAVPMYLHQNTSITSKDDDEEDQFAYDQALADIVEIQKNFRHQIGYWSERIQQVEQTVASVEMRCESVEPQNLPQQPQNNNQKGEPPHEVLATRTEALEAAQKNKKNNDSYDSGIYKPTVIGSEGIAKGISDISSTTAPDSLGLESQDYTPSLTNDGLIKILKNMDFKNMAHFQLLCVLDSRTFSRKLPISCDIANCISFNVNCIIRSGPWAPSIVGHPACKRSPDGDLRKYKEHDFEKPRVVKLSYHLKGGQGGKRTLAEWEKAVCPPRYVYDLGQLCLNHNGEDQGDQSKLIATWFNVVVDIVEPEKPVWLIKRAGFELEEAHHPGSDRTRKRTKQPFQPSGEPDSRSCIAALLAKNLTDLDFTPRPCGPMPYSEFRDALEQAMTMWWGTEVGMEFSIPGFEELMEIHEEGAVEKYAVVMGNSD
ncbi:hypothetical protein E0Z10_g3774 [Xylaria hypoxylon]|uniref:Uncharacterized protein n=1 Tax=Xylaria hypoxylon TaxID=37992 RepID=A0A4Z0YYC8_9PEZI|nr:hypothetical protein E0Z10_g3774 [Xylaria hypoxylon]